MQLLTVPNWSFSSHENLSGIFKDVLHCYGLTLHYLQGDVDHHRMVAAFSGPDQQVLDALQELSIQILPCIDLQVHQGVHPRYGALDVCPFIPLETSHFEVLNLKIKKWADQFAQHFKIPVFLYEKSSENQMQLPALRKAFLEYDCRNRLCPDYGPHQPHPKWGMMITGIRDFLIAMNVNIETRDCQLVKDIAHFIRQSRENKESWASGVRALGFSLKSRNLMQISMNLTFPDVSHPDQIINKITDLCHQMEVNVHSTELIGVIRKKDLPFSTLLSIRPEQIIECD